MAYALICANVVTEETISFSGDVACSPRFTPVALGDKFHVVITGAEPVPGDEPHIEFAYTLSLEYQFANGFDYCHIEGTGSVLLPVSSSQCTALPLVVDCKPTLTDIGILDRAITATLNIDFTVKLCSEQILKVLLAED